MTRIQRWACWSENYIPIQIVLFMSSYEILTKTKVNCWVLSALLSNLKQAAQYIHGVVPTSSNTNHLNSCFQDNWNFACTSAYKLCLYMPPFSHQYPNSTALNRDEKEVIWFPPYLPPSSAPLFSVLFYCLCKWVTAIWQVHHINLKLIFQLTARFCCPPQKNHLLQI